jgi:hypothetical protein
LEAFRTTSMASSFGISIPKRARAQHHELNPSSQLRTTR